MTKKLQLNLEIIKLAERKMVELDAAFQRLGTGFYPVVKNFIERSRVTHTICRVLSVYLMNKLDLQYSSTRTKTLKQIKYENHLLVNELYRFINDKNSNPFGPNMSPMLRLLNKKLILEAYNVDQAYVKTDLESFRQNDPSFVHVSLSTIIEQYEKYTDEDDDLVRVSIFAKAGLA